MSDDPKINFWLSWYGELPMSEFELHSPWWISGYDAEDRPVICAAIQATSADSAIDYVLQSYDIPPAGVQWRFVEERPTDWSPFNGRFEQAKWMAWPPSPNATASAKACPEKSPRAELGGTRTTQHWRLSQMTDLANCPFCGDAPVIRRTMQDYPADDVHPAGQYEAAVHVCCVTCGFELVEEYQSEVIAAWNRRATTRTSEAEPVACADCGAKDPFMYPCHQQGCPHSPTPASDDQVEAVLPEWATDKHIAEGVLERAETIQLIIYERPHEVAEHVSALIGE